MKVRYFDFLGNDASFLDISDEAIIKKIDLRLIMTELLTRKNSAYIEYNAQKEIISLITEPDLIKEQYKNLCPELVPTILTIENLEYEILQLKSEISKLKDTKGRIRQMEGDLFECYNEINELTKSLERLDKELDKWKDFGGRIKSLEDRQKLDIIEECFNKFSLIEIQKRLKNE